MKALALTFGLLMSTLAFGWTTVTEDNLVAETATATGPIVFTAEWCEACQALMPILDKLEAEYPALKFMKVDVDANPGLAEIFAPRIPVTYFLMDGKIVATATGGGTEEEVREYFKGYVEFLQQNQ